MISAVVLAAGKAERMGRQKLLLPLRGKPVLQWVLESVLSAAVDEVICVVRETYPTQQNISVVDSRLRWVVNERADEGQSTSVVLGLRQIDTRSEAALFLVGDQPMVQTQLINALVARFNNSPAWIVAPSFREQTRNPVLFRRNLFPELLQLTGDRGGRGLVQKYRERTAQVDWNDELPFLDLDVPADYEKLKRLV